jgi:hypothetical protein
MSDDPRDRYAGDPIAAAIAEYVHVYADGSHMWEKYHSERDAGREGAERVAAAAAGLEVGALCGILNAQPRPPRGGDRRAEWVARTTERVLALWRSGGLGPITDGD